MRKKKEKPVPPPIAYHARWWPNDPVRKRASIQIKRGSDVVYEAWFDDINEQELQQMESVILDLYIVGVNHEYN
jgi:hypothetical protein